MNPLILSSFQNPPPLQALTPDGGFAPVLVPLISGAAPGTARPPGHLCGMEQLVARQVHTLEVAGSSPAPAILLYDLLPFCPCRVVGAFHLSDFDIR